MENYLNTSNFFRVFENKEYNANHWFFIKLAALGIAKVIVTTNFDTLFEYASKKIEKENSLISKFITNSFLETEENSIDNVPLIKLHGCISDMSSLKNTMERVSNKSWVNTIKKNIEKIIDSYRINKIIFFGYSFSDDFDINPAFNSIDLGNIQIIVVNHTKGYKRFEPIQNDSYKYPFPEKKLTIYNIDTDWLIKENSNYLNLTTLCSNDFNKQVSILSKWQTKVDTWINSFENGRRELVTAFLFMRLKEYQVSIEQLEKLFDKPKELNDEILFFTYNLMAINYLELGGESNYKLAYKKIQKAENLIDYSDNLNHLHKSKINQTKGNYYHYLDVDGENSKKLKNRKKASQAYNLSINNAENIDDQKSIAVSKLSLANLYRNGENYEEAYSLYRESYKIKARLGDLNGKGNCFHGLGNVCFAKEMYSSARRFYKLFNLIAELIGEKITISNSYYCLAEVYFELNKQKEAVKFADKCFSIRKTLPDSNLRKKNILSLRKKISNMK